MEERHLKIFAGVFAALLVIFLISKPRHAGVNLDDFIQSVVFGFSKEDVKSVEVYKELPSENRAQMMFVGLEDESWRMPTYYNAKVQKSKIDRLLNDIIDMTGKVRSSDPKHFDTYQISDEQGIHLLLKDEGENPLANLIIGKKSEDYGSGFVRFAGSEKVFSVDKNILSALNIYGDIDTLSAFKSSNFVDLQAVDQENEDLELIGLVAERKEMIVKRVEKEIEVMQEDSTMTTKKEKEWVLVQGTREIELDQDEVEQFLSDVTRIRGTEVVDRIGGSLADINKTSQYGFSRPTHYIVFRAPEKEQENVLFGMSYEEDKGYYMNVQYDGLVYKVSKSNYDKIFKWIEDLPTKKKTESDD